MREVSGFGVPKTKEEDEIPTRARSQEEVDVVRITWVRRDMRGVTSNRPV